MGDLSRALHTYRRLQILKIAPTTETLNAVMSVYFEKGDLTEVENMYAKFSEVGLVPDRVTYETLIGIYYSLSLEKTEAFYTEMLQRQFPIGLATSNKMLSSYVKFAFQPRANRTSDNSGETTEKTISDIAIAEKAEELYQQIQQKDEGTYDTIITFYAKIDTKKAQNVFNEVCFIATLYSL